MTKPRRTLNGRLQIDGTRYEDVAFTNAELIYRGGEPPAFSNCTFEGSTFTFDDAAGATIAFLRAMSPAQTGMRPIVLGLLPELNLQA